MKEDNDYSINKAFIHSFDYILFSQCSLCSCFFFFAMLFTMNNYCFTNDDTAYILKYSIAREAIEAAIVHVFKT